jgi:hypothetical protein
MRLALRDRRLIQKALGDLRESFVSTPIGRPFSGPCQAVNSPFLS